MADVPEKVDALTAPLQIGNVASGTYIEFPVGVGPVLKYVNNVLVGELSWALPE